MPLLHATHLSYQFENGVYLFNNISCCLQARLTGLIGRNGSGKSILAELLSQKRIPTTGSVTLNTQVQGYHQYALDDISPHLTIAQFLEIEHILDALDMIEQGHIDTKWFDIIGDNWLLKEKISHLLLQLKLPSDTRMLCQKLSGGQLSFLRLWKLFQSDAGLLILDEPSNHLDLQAKKWLIQQIQHFSGHILLISHDRLLLREMEHIWELSSLGLTEYGGNYDCYVNQKTQDQGAIERQLSQLQTQQKKEQKQYQSNKEKADKRAAMGNKTRKKGSQSKMLLNAMKDKATSKASSRIKQYQSHSKSLQQAVNQLHARQAQPQEHHLPLPQTSNKKTSLLRIERGILPFGDIRPIQLCLYSNDKIHLQGANGSGKSTLFNVLLKKINLKQGKLHMNTALYFLDQHIDLMSNNQSILEYIQADNHSHNETQNRTLLAGIGFKGDTVYRPVHQLSGGERVKLALLTVNLNDRQPLMLLDEPDNHLDIESKQMLANMLAAYKGAFMLISHDNAFVKQCGITQTLTLVDL
ncbi:ATP-binding cassette domain-containing protein [uncultured Shewanella sp.]|uniref:ATP-binding cassette domain-containing protein n=1 Tax=uncultured Shewanella sp. TaxID=173975 RepID=UPI00261A2595|nr:ATP-binding cassette domain-containing protein [uncultured Shewanella sp.]